MKRGLTLFLVVLLIMAMSLPAFADNNKSNNGNNDNNGNFSDVNEKHYAYQAIMTMKARGIISGYGDNTFRPNNIVTRVEFAAMMVQALDLDVDKTVKSSFIDMKGEGWAIPYVEAAKYYMTGYKTDEGYEFRPRQAAVREDMAVALVKALELKLKNDDILDDYEDEGLISENLREYVATAIENKLMVGTEEDGDKYFNPQAYLTRAEAAALLMNVIEEVEKVTFDEEENNDGDKVIIGDEEEAYAVPEVTVKYVDLDADEDDPEDEDDAEEQEDPEDIYDAIKISWDKISDSRFVGYKIVASESDSTPSYPSDGYFTFITNENRTSIELEAGDDYIGGDFDEFESGETYYFTVTAVYDDDVYVTGNVVKVEMP